MAVLIVVIIILLVVALYPAVRDLLRRRATTAPAYVEGLQLLLDGKPAEALSRLKEAVSADPNNIDAYIRLGNVLIEQGETERGIKVHENLALRRNLSPTDEQRLLRALAADYLATDRKLKAISTLEELTRLDRHDKRAVEQLVRLYLETASWERCESLARELGRNPVDRPWAARLLAELGRACSESHPKAAQEYFNEALRLDRSSIAARLYLGDHQMSGRDIEAATRTWNEILELEPGKNYLVRPRLEAAYYETGRYNEITQVYEQLLRKVPDDEGLAVALAEIYWKREELPRAVRLLERFTKTRTEPAAGITLAALLLKQGEDGRAGRLLEEVMARLKADRLKCPNCGAAQTRPGLSCEQCRTWLK